MLSLKYLCKNDEIIKTFSEKHADLDFLLFGILIAMQQKKMCL